MADAAASETTAGAALPGSRVPGVSDLMARAARLHYEYGLTHQDTADALGVSRVKVTRLLKQARQAGIVSIRVISTVSPFAELEDRLAAVSGLREAIIVPAADDSAATRGMLARGAAGYLERVISDGMVVAVGLSRTIAEMPGWLASPRPSRAAFVALAGAMRTGGQGSGNPYQAADALAAAFGGSAEHLHSPVIVANRKIAEQLRTDPAIAETLARAAAADIAFVGLGGRDDRVDFSQGVHISRQEWATLLADGMVGDIGGRFFDCHGLQLDHDLNHRVIALDLDQFAKIPVRVIAAAGTSKVDALRAALAGHLATVLVTDIDTAQALLESL